MCMQRLKEDIDDPLCLLSAFPLETGSLTRSGARLVASKPRGFVSTFHPTLVLQARADVPSF